MADRGYQRFQHEVIKGKWIIKKRRPKNKQHSKEDQELNSKIEVIWRHIDMAFGGVKLMFDCLLRPWRHDRTWLTPVVKFCCAVWNNKVLYERIGNEYSSQWDHPIPQILNPKFHSKKVQSSSALLFFLSCLNRLNFYFILDCSYILFSLYNNLLVFEIE
jgi:hypothetical protein